MNFDIDNEVYDYNFDVPLCGNFDDFPVDDTDWFENINEAGEEIDENKENTPTINMSTNSKGIQRPSLHRKNNVENTEDNINEMNNSTDAVCQDPITVMKSKKEKLLSNLKQFNKLDERDEDEAFIKRNEAQVITSNNKQKRPEIVSQKPAYLQQTMTVCKPKLMDQLCKTAVKSSSTLRPAQTLPKKQPTRAVAPSFMARKQNNNSDSSNNNNSGSIGLSRAAVGRAAWQPPNTTRKEKVKVGSGAVGGVIASTARTQMLAPSALGKHAVLPLGATRIEKAKKKSDNASISGDTNGRPKQTNTVPMAPQLATSQRANMKKEKFEAMQGSTATGTRTVTGDRQSALAKPPVLGKPPVQRSATLGRNAVDRKPGNHPGREEHKEKGEDKSAARQRSSKSSTLPRPANPPANLPARNARNPAIWNY